MKAKYNMSVNPKTDRFHKALVPHTKQNYSDKSLQESKDLKLEGL